MPKPYKPHVGGPLADYADGFVSELSRLRYAEAALANPVRVSSAEPVARKRGRHPRRAGADRGRTVPLMVEVGRVAAGADWASARPAF